MCWILSTQNIFHFFISTIAINAYVFKSKWICHFDLVLNKMVLHFLKSIFKIFYLRARSHPSPHSDVIWVSLKNHLHYFNLLVASDFTFSLCRFNLTWFTMRSRLTFISCVFPRVLLVRWCVFASEAELHWLISDESSVLHYLIRLGLSICQLIPASSLHVSLILQQRLSLALASSTMPTSALPMLHFFCNVLHPKLYTHFHFS